jgi:type IV secretion system protein VirD4
LKSLEEQPLFDEAPKATTNAPEPESVKPALAAPEPAAFAAPAPAAAIAAPEPETIFVETTEPAAAAGVVAAASAGDDEDDNFSLDPPAFDSFKTLLNQAGEVAKTHPVVARLKKVVEEDASAGLLEPGTDLSTFIRA